MAKGFKQQWMRKLRFLTQALIFSGALNIGLLATFIHFVLQDRQTIISFDHRPKESVNSSSEITNENMLCLYSRYSYRELVALLSHKELMEEGFTKRDLALSCLVGFHYFDLKRALSGQTYQKRTLVSSHFDRPLQIFPGLSDFHYESIIHFAYREKWPLTSEGIFLLLKKRKDCEENSLKQAFLLTEEFLCMQTLLTRNGKIEKERLLSILLEGDWELIEKITREQKSSQDLSDQRRHFVLLNYLEKGSPTAAKLLVEREFGFVLKRLDDSRILKILDFLSEKTEISEQFCLSLLKSPRSDTIWKKSAELLYSYANEKTPESFTYSSACSHFLQEPVELLPNEIVWEKGRCLHVVQEGDNLWKIARKYRIDIQELMRVNALEDDCIFPGSQIEIPSQVQDHSHLDARDHTYKSS